MHLAAGEFNLAVFQGKQGVVRADSDVKTRLEFCSALAEDNGTGRDDLPTVGFNAEILGIAVAPVPGGALSFFMCHNSPGHWSKIGLPSIRQGGRIYCIEP